MTRLHRVRIRKPTIGVFTQLNTVRLELLLALLVVATLLCSLIAAHTVRPYTSDDVTTQTILQSWEHGEARNAVSGADTYLIKWPFFWLHDLLVPHDSRLKLFESVVFFNLIFALGVLFFVRTTLPQLRNNRLSLLLVYLPIAWFFGLYVLPIVSVFEVSRVTTYMNPDYRNAEVGIAFILVALIVRFTRRTQQIRRLSVPAITYLLAGFLGLAAYFYSDPYFIYTLCIPLVLVTAMLWLRSDARTSKMSVVTLYFLLAAGASMTVVKSIVLHFGFQALDNVPSQFISTDAISQSLSNTAYGLEKTFSAIISGQTLGLHLLPQLVNFCLLVVAVTGLIHLWRTPRLQSLSTGLLASITLINLLIFTFSTTNSTDTDRYLVIGAVSMTVLLGYIGAHLSSYRIKLLLVMLYVVAISVNVLGNLHIIHRQLSATATKPNQANQLIVNTVAKYGLTKGYTSYWDGNINTYLSSMSQHYLPVTCTDGQLYAFYWVVNKSEFKLPVRQSFYLYGKESGWTSLQACTVNILQKQFGVAPSKTVPINDTYTLYIYNIDIGQFLK